MASITEGMAAPARPNTGSSFLDILSQDIRREIFKYLLVDPELGSDSRHIWTSPGSNLSIPLLRVCRQVYEEGTDVLYGSNTFMVLCLDEGHGGLAWGHSDDISPFLRYEGENPDPTPFPFPQESCVVGKIRHWKVILNGLRPPSESDQPSKLLQFCRQIAGTSPNLLEVMIFPRVVETFTRNTHYLQPSEFLAPLRLLRNVERFELRDVTYTDLPDSLLDAFFDREYRSQKPAPVLEVELTLLATGDEPIEWVHKMWEQLLRYAQCFERSEPFKVAMGFTETEWDRAKDDEDQFLIWNPFIEDESIHPVEQAMRQAKHAYNLDYTKDFKEKRAEVLEYFEKQYQRIVVAAKAMADFVKEEKRPYLLFDAKNDNFDKWHFDDTAAVKGLLLLEQYANAFKRDMPLATSVEIRKKQRCFDGYYRFLPRELLMLQLDHVVEHGDYRVFLRLLQQAVDDMGKQYLEIRSARKALFDFDLFDRSCDLDLEMVRCDEMIDWTVNEPDFGPEEGVNDENMAEVSDGYDSDLPPSDYGHYSVTSDDLDSPADYDFNDDHISEDRSEAAEWDNDAFAQDAMESNEEGFDVRPTDSSEYDNGSGEGTNSGEPMMEDDVEVPEDG